jgi:predicted secreted hydrolase
LVSERLTRRLVLTGAAALFAPRLSPLARAAPEAAAGELAEVVSGRELSFPRDFGAHPDFRTEWWYVTGWLRSAAGEDLGFQVTFFRTRITAADTNPSAFAPRQILIAHAAVSDPRRGRLLHAQRIAREGFGLAYATIGRTEVRIDDWSLVTEGEALIAHVVAPDFAFELRLERTQPPLLQGERGYSRKGIDPASASYYYSLPQLRVSGRLERESRASEVKGTAWLDQEWSTAYLERGAVGWDWIGINGADGSALMAFRIRRADGTAHWAGATLRDARGEARAFAPHEIEWTKLREWRSTRTGITWPVAFRVRVGALDLTLEPLMDDQESDTRATTGAVYWEGAVRAFEGGRLFGRGYLELTGYGAPLELGVG